MKKILCLLLTLSLCLTASLLPARAENEVQTYDGWLYTVENEEVTIRGYVDKSAEELNIPEMIQGMPVTVIGERAFADGVNFQEGPPSGFSNYKFTKMTFPSTLKRIEDYAFCGTYLKSIILNEGLEYIGTSAFQNCRSYRIVFPNTLKYIGDDACRGMTGLLSMNWDADLDEDDPLSYNLLVIPESVEYLGAGAFENCKFMWYAVVLCPAASYHLFWGCNNLLAVFFSDLCGKLSPYMFGSYSYDIRIPSQIIGYDGTYAEQFAQDMGVEFISVGRRPGDVDLDNKLTVSDVVALRNLIAADNANDEQQKVGDLDKDGELTVADVVAMRQRIIRIG